MKKFAWRASVCAGVLGALAAIPAQAGNVTFDDLAPNLYFPGDGFVSGGMTFSVPTGPFFGIPQPGFGIVDTAASLSLFSNAPTGNATQFYAGLNDNFLRMTSASPTFVLTAFDFGFVPPVPSPNTISPGALVAYWTDIHGVDGFSAFDFGNSDSNGDWAFLRANMATPSFGVGTSTDLRSVTFFACLYSGITCNWPANNQAQFALDNVAFVPLPSTWLLAGLGLAGLVVARRRVAR